jgi:hypothetical protein
MLLASVRNVVIATAAFIGGGFVSAQQEREDVSLLNASVGAVDVDRNRYSAGELSIGHRWARGVWALRPLAGLAFTSKRAVFLWGGIGYDIGMGRLSLTPSFGPGLYSAGDGIDLGYPLEFRSQLEVGCRISRSSRIGVAFAHMSNASLGHTNPGTELLLVNYSLGIGRLQP